MNLVNFTAIGNLSGSCSRLYAAPNNNATIADMVVFNDASGIKGLQFYGNNNKTQKFGIT